jgi:phosphogluconate dehydratase
MSGDIDADRWGSGRELFAGMRALVSGAEDGAMTFHLNERQ